ncbi:hypothetical protein BASA81_003458 [Batrachochytrium salamandrivorans]|nr:hypothetical protein BASA81_003458 [Batrachochytrium salamandrivorans]
MRTTLATTLVGLEQQKLAIQTLLNASASVRQQVEFDLANSWQAMRTSGIDRTWDTYYEMQHMASEYFGLQVYLDESFRGTLEWICSNLQSKMSFTLGSITIWTLLVLWSANVWESSSKSFPLPQ